MEFILPFLFFFVALIYSSVGLGGGSSYTALMTIFGINYLLIPTVSLTLNLIVTLLGVINFSRNGHLRWSLILPFLVTSIPMSYLAGSLVLPEPIFYGLLLVTLVFVVIRIYIVKELTMSFHLEGCWKWVFSLLLGGLLGFIAGAVGIGGGIYLVPLLIMFGLGTEKEAAASGTVFIFVNSLAGLVARFQQGAYDISFMLPLVAAVMVGGFAGSYLGAKLFKPKTIQKVMGIVILIAIIFLLNKVFQ